MNKSHEKDLEAIRTNHKEVPCARVALNVLTIDDMFSVMSEYDETLY